MYGNIQAQLQTFFSNIKTPYKVFKQEYVNPPLLIYNSWQKVTQQRSNRTYIAVKQLVMAEWNIALQMITAQCTQIYIVTVWGT